MSKLRLIFSKEAQASYVSHLDLMRNFQRAFPRVGLEIAHSNGFHPHPVLSIVLPLPVGQESGCELLDFAITAESDGAGIAEKLNSGLPLGLRVRECYVAQRPIKELRYVRATVTLLYDGGVPEGAAEQLQALFASPTLVIQKRTKRKELADVDLIPLIHSLRFAPQEKAVVVDALLAAQNPGMNPALLAAAIRENCPALAPDFVRVRRVDVLDENGASFR